jgi:hypothetical protein
MTAEILEIVLLILGVILIFISIFGAGRIKQRLFNLSYKEFVFKADNVLLLLVFGFIMCMTGIYFKTKGYEDQIAALKASDLKATSEYELLHKEIDRLKRYSYIIYANFPDSIKVNQDKISVRTFKPGSKPTPRPATINRVAGPSGYIVYEIGLDDVAKDDEIEISHPSSDSTIFWVSQVKVPTIITNMNKGTTR